MYFEKKILLGALFDTHQMSFNLLNIEQKFNKKVHVKILSNNSKHIFIPLFITYTIFGT